MNYISSTFDRVNLLSRNEGKIKSYESCLDIRGWSHDNDKRDRYLREWIKSDMPKSVIPARTLLSIVNKMTRCSKLLVTPRCHINCKSKVLLESICNSCHEMKECFRNDQAFDKYFEEEQFETSHWPCERCLDALKSIKLFWKIIVEKVLNVNVPKSHEMDHSTYCADNVKSVAKLWQTDMERQTMFVKKSKAHISHSAYAWTENTAPQKKAAPCNFNLNCTNSSDFNNIHYDKPRHLGLNRYSKATDTQDLLNSFKRPSSQTLNRFTSTIFSTVDAACSVNLKNEITTYKVNLNCLQEKLDAKSNEIRKLKNENGCLKMELRTLYNNSWWKTLQTPAVASSTNDFTEKIKPFETCECEEYISMNPVKTIDSETIITMKNCTNESYKHISLLQVLHKTNDPNIRDLTFHTEACCKKEDPIVLLEKVQNTFGAIVSREMSRASDRGCCEEAIDIDASYHNAIVSKLELSSSTTTLTRCD